ncbi:hypothetical protein [Halorubrum vacuolatum]|uniref:Uncharacterized protein n=1 Tax=Halorubrum vacuolatum TaxID=63740 RepID=A0A238WSF0_HALVU|nr:hypothetical protein [Halorubrum vacuolatum]SNR49164.1 hypothetical protein SAMN06264855_109119 [Halorubrum vacuolatum]
MVSTKPAHGGAQTTELTIDLIAEGIHRPGDPEHVEATITLDANRTLQVELETGEAYADWRVDARIVNRSLEATYAVRDGSGVDGDLPHWVTDALEIVGDRLEIDQR